MSRYDTPKTEELHELSLNGGPDAELGDAQTFGWFGKMKSHGNELPVILHEDSQGFVESFEYLTQWECDEAWEQLEAEWLEYTADEDSAITDDMKGREGNG